MNIHEIKNLPSDELEALLVGESITAEEQVYMKPLSEDELAIKKDELAQSSIMSAVIVSEFDEIKKQHKEKMKPLKSAIHSTIQAIKNKALEVKGKVYRMPDYENQMIHIVDPSGIVISSRRMLPEERQFRISSISKAV